MEAWLCTAFNIEKQRNWPIAPIMLHVDRPSLITTDKDFWIRADPVHLRIEQNHIMLADSQAFQISEEEAKQITHDLNQNLGRYHNFSVLPLHSDRWYIQLATAPEMHTHTLGQVTCMNINNFLPTGKDSITWHKIFNEAQMLLHEHSVNQQRESRGELTVNSIWFWGGGVMPDSIRSSYTHIWSNHEFPRALALASKTKHSRQPLHANEWLSQPELSENHLVVLDTLLQNAKYRNAYNWRETINEMENNWFSPLYQALKKGKIKQLNITALHEKLSMEFVITHSNLWKFWLMTQPLSSYIVKHYAS